MSDESQDAGRWLVRVTPEGGPSEVPQARAWSRETNAAARELMDPALRAASETDDEIPGDTPGDPVLPVRVLRPVNEDPVPTVVYFHGGGWVLGDLDTHLGHARRLSAQVGAVVVSVAFRLAPEHRFPAAFDDAARATEWVAQRLDGFGGDGRLVVAGDGSGAQLAASVAIARRDAGQPLAAQLLLYPVTDVAGRYEDEKVNGGYMSRTSRYRRYGLTLESMVDFAHAYVDEADAGDWRVSPKRAASLAGVAPAVVHTSTIDVLRTEGNFFADDLRAAGVEVLAREHPSLNHSDLGADGVPAVADAAGAEAAEDLRSLLQLHAPLR